MNEIRRTKTTLADLAQALGVSKATVSNAYNRPEKLSHALRERILQAAHDLGYPGPDPAARGLSRGEAGTIGVLYADRLSFAFTDPAYVLFLQGLASAAETAGLALTLAPGAPRAERTPRAIGHAAVDGFIVYSMAHDDPLVRAAVERQLPLVTVDQPQLADVPFVGIDDAGAARAAAQHLLDLGHRRLGVLSLELGVSGHAGIVDATRQAQASAQMVHARLEGYKQAVTHVAGSWIEDVTVYECAENLPREGVDAARALFTLASPPTALLAMSDQLALGALEAALELGLDVPDDLSIVGFDDAPEAARARIPLTTVRQPHREKGRVAGELLIARWHGATSVRIEQFPTELIIRRSTAPVR